MHDLEAFARTEKEEIARLVEEARKPVYLPSLDELAALATNLEACMMADVERGRAMLLRWLHEGIIKVGIGPEGPYATCDLLPMIVLTDADTRKRKIPGGSTSKDFKLFASSSGGRI
ncbi:MAG: hypothetical protein H6Q90_2858 [Deltaproteobacteria bacterium]|nr:hypothetical protein [Deltaproteobacteria bacterium]